MAKLDVMWLKEQLKANKGGKPETWLWDAELWQLYMCSTVKIPFVTFQYCTFKQEQKRITYETPF
jgi:hypothetical protein